MDKYEFNIKIDQIKKRMDEGDYRTAMKIADAIDWSRVRNINLLTMASSVYEKNGEYDEAKDKLLLAFERAPVGKHLLYKLTELAVKSGDLEEAKDYYNEFMDVAPDDANAHLLAYMILEKAGAPYDRLIAELSAYTATEPDEKWLYELAKVYDEAGMSRECVACCDRIALLFGAGRYSEKAMKLKSRYQRLSGSQQELISEDQELPVKEDARSAEEIGDELAAIRYENEDEAFEEYLKAHRLDEPLVSIDEEAVKTEPGRTELREELSREVEKISRDKASEEASTDEPETEKTLVFDGEKLEELRRVIIKGETISAKPEPAGKAEPPDAGTALRNAAKQAAGIVSFIEQRPAVSISVESVKPAPAPGLGKEDVAPVVEADKKVAELRSAEARNEAEKKLSEAAGSEEAEEAKVKETAPSPEADGTEEKAADETSAAAEKAEKEQASEKAEASVQKAEAVEESDRTPVPLEEAVGQPETAKHHMIIEAEDEASGFEIAKDELKNIHREYGIQNAALKTTAEKLNERGLSDEIIGKIRGKDFIIEHAGSLNPKLLDRIYRLIKDDDSGMIAVLIDVPEGLDRIEERKPELFRLCDLVSDFEDEYEDPEEDIAEEDSEGSGEAYDEDTDEEPYSEDADEPYHEDDEEEEPYSDEDEYDASEEDYEEDADEDLDDEDYEGEEPEEKPAELRKRGSRKDTEGLHNNLRVNAPDASDEEMEIDDFAQYCCQYASEIDCSISGKSMLALYERIELMEEDNIPLTRKNAVKLIEEAADRAEKPPIGKRIKGMFSSKYDKNGLLILKEEDFIY